ncbi:MAG: ATP-binding protein, partial [Eubacteriales bacterium]|nr:ATP-binding protein [Eubacteriales bacterium]
SGTLHLIPSVYLCGPMGVGKSTAVREIAKNLSGEIKKEVQVTDIRLLNFSPVDLRGIPAADADKQFSVWLKPKIFDLPEDEVSILFLDELSAAPQSIQAAAYQIALDKRIGEFALPKNCIVICAGNRTTDRSVAFRMPKALANRLIHFEIISDFDSWHEWALCHNIDARVIGYLAFDNSRLNAEPELEELAFPTPRSWEFVSRLLKTTGKSPEDTHALISGCIGVSNALEFEAWCRVYKKLPRTADILAGRYIDKVKETDVIFALFSSLQVWISNHRTTISDEELENACRYASRFTPDFAAMFYRGLLGIEGMERRMVKTRSFSAWMKQNSRLI